MSRSGAGRSAHGAGAVERLADDVCVAPALALGSLEAEFTVLEPPDLRTFLRDWADRFKRAIRPV